ncbi:MAG: LytTR family DNA-binding domain-containing protein [Chitinophagales bacterium]|nr:LytTR family DNA-binding domain-containing protein [Chitinophagales bacterium]
MINAIIIDDEINAIKTLSNDLAKYCPDVHIIQKCKSAKDGLKAIKQLKPDLVFLDINMPWMSGIELLEVIEDITFDVIFTTAHDQYAVKAFKLSVTDYLLKPIDHQELIIAVEKVSTKKKHLSREQLVQLRNNMDTNTPLLRVGIPTPEGIDFISLQDILYCEAQSNYTYIHLTDDKHLISARTLKEFDQLLANDHFCRIHQSFLINLNHLKKYYRGDGGYVVMANQASLNVSRSKKEELLRKIKM